MFIRSGYSAQTRSWCSGTKHHHSTPDVVDGRRDLFPPGRTQSTGPRFALDLPGVHLIEPDPIELARHRAVGAHNLTLALEDEAIAVSSNRRRAARIEHSIELANVRQR